MTGERRADMWWSLKCCNICPDLHLLCFGVSLIPNLTSLSLSLFATLRVQQQQLKHTKIKSGEGKSNLRKRRQIIRGRIRAPPLHGFRRRTQYELHQPRQLVLRPSHALLRMGMGNVLPFFESPSPRDFRRGDEAS